MENSTHHSGSCRSDRCMNQFQTKGPISLAQLKACNCSTNSYHQGTTQLGLGGGGGGRALAINLNLPFHPFLFQVAESSPDAHPTFNGPSRKSMSPAK